MRKNGRNRKRTFFNDVINYNFPLNGVPYNLTPEAGSRSVFEIWPATQFNGSLQIRIHNPGDRVKRSADFAFSPNALPARRCRGGREIRRPKPSELIGRGWRRRCRRIPGGGVRRWRQQAFQLLDNTPVGFWDPCSVQTDTYIQCSGSGIRCLFVPLDPGWVKKTRSGSGMNIPDHISKSLETTIFWVKNTLIL
jgi:hypothetical protein